MSHMDHLCCTLYELCLAQELNFAFDSLFEAGQVVKHA